ncbi:MAG: MBL fold metallo-hydrolase, partial [Muribaculaceae bacterium]|nr:MBL fold metallo-hydrolase [Muribaculaceae bacterium]
ITDCSQMPSETVEALRGVDTLVINALRHDKHPSHLSLSEALDIVARVAPRRTFLTHMSHDMGPEATVNLPAGVAFAHDGLVVDVPVKNSERQN